MNVGEELLPKWLISSVAPWIAKANPFLCETLRPNGVVQHVESSIQHLRATLEQNICFRAGDVDHGDYSCALPRATLHKQ